MACSGSHCTNHGTGMASCGGHRTSCSTNRPLTGTVPLSISGSPAYASAINELKGLMNAELDRYRQHRFFATLPLITSTFASNGPITSTGWASMATTFFNTTPTPTPDSPLDNVFWQAMIAKYDTIRQDCICNTDCSCNAVCSCHNNCDCHYSDARLKQDIEYC